MLMLVVRFIDRIVGAIVTLSSPAEERGAGSPLVVMLVLSLLFRR